MIVRNNQSAFINPNTGNYLGIQSDNIGKVFHVIIDSNSVGFKDWSSIGDVYYVGLNEKFPTPDTVTNIASLTGYSPAKSLSFSNSFIPFIGELILLIEGPSRDSSEINGQKQTYYLNPINLYNNQNHNSQAIYNITKDGEVILGNKIQEKITRNILPFEGDNIIHSRWGAGLRFSSTLNFNEQENFWSASGIDGDPITLLVNGYNTNNKDFSFYVENINNDASSIYLTSTQTVSNFVPNTVISPNPFTSLIGANTYGEKSQIILSSNRISLSSNKDEIVMYSNTNIELGANNTIHINGKENIYLNSPKVFLGHINLDTIDPLKNDDIPQPVLMGYDTQLFLSKLLNILNKFSSDLSTAISAPVGSKELSVTVPAVAMQQSLDSLRKDLKDILSESTFVSR
jgi:hypothetical protein